MIKITRGKDKDFFVNLFSKSTKRPFDLSSLVWARVKIPTSSGYLEKTYPGGGITVASVGGGRAKVSLEVAETGNLKVSKGATLEFEYELGVDVHGHANNYNDTVYILNAYQVV